MLDLKNIEGISKAIDEHLRRLESFSVILKEIKEYLKAANENQTLLLTSEINDMKLELNEISIQLKKQGVQLPDSYEKKMNEIKRLLDSESWPKAIDDESICITNEDKISRAEFILDIFIGENLEDKRFLDFGCGEGHVIEEAIKRGLRKPIGYDVNLSKLTVEDKDNFTQDINLVRKIGPYDVILLHDVLDHLEGNPIELLKTLSSILAPAGRIYIKNHPWSSRHGGHLYTKKNKAFLHLILDETELVRIGGYELDFNLKITNPLGVYRNWFKESNLKIISEITVRSEVEPLFKENIIIKNILIGASKDANFISDCMEIDFVEYVLESNDNIVNNSVLI